MALSTTEPAPLAVISMVQKGWLGFQRAPWLFVGFTLVAGVLNWLTSAIQNKANEAMEAASGVAIGPLILFLIGLVLSVLVSLWTNIGLFRGAWKAVGGQVPVLRDFIRWDSVAMVRLFLMGLLLLVVFGGVALISVLSGGLLSMIRLELSILPLAAGALVTGWLAVTQMFHLPLVVARGDQPWSAFQHGREVVQPQFWRLLAFALLMFAITVLGLALFGVGILIAGPVVVCSLVAAYHSLFGDEDRTGFLAG
ncbi:MAG: hypothetical protein ACOYMY_10345 [Prochlorococcaceae cyanobacterium]|jgi:hypothetical protein